MSLTRPEAAHALRATLRELLASTQGAARAANHAAGLALNHKRSLATEASLTRESAYLLLHTVEHLYRSAQSTQPQSGGMRLRSQVSPSHRDHQA